MAVEAYVSASVPDLRLEALKAGELIDQLDRSLQASTPLDDKVGPGLVRTLFYEKGGDWSDGLGPFTPGTDRVRDLNIRATFANQQPLARKNLQHNQPRALHVLLEHGQRYQGTTGLHSLTGLARLTLAVAGLAVEGKTAMQLTLTSEEGSTRSPDLDQPFEALDAVRSYDAYHHSLDRKAPARSTSALAEGIFRLLDEEEGIRAGSDACLVISDFTAGAQRSGTGELSEFDWQLPIDRLENMLGDRLFVVRLTSPAYTDLRFARQYLASGVPYMIDAGDYIPAAAEYARLGKEKAGRIGEALSHLRILELSTQDKRPVVTAGEFLLGTSPEA